MTENNKHVWILYANHADSTKTAIAAYSNKDKAREHIDSVDKKTKDLLNITSFSIASLNLR